MTVQSTLCKHVYDGNGITTEWPYTFLVLSSDNIKVFINDLEITSRFGIDTGTSNVTYPQNLEGQEPVLSPLPVGAKITIKRVLTLDQLMDLYNTGGFPAEALEAAYDKLTMIVQQMDDDLKRSVKFPIGSNPTAEETEDFLNTITTASAEAVAAAATVDASEAAAVAAAAAAAISEDNATAAAAAALVSKNAAADSEAAAAISEINAAASEIAAAGSAASITGDAAAAAASAAAASTSEDNAATSETNAGISEASALASKNAAAASQSAAAASAATAAAATGFVFFGVDTTWDGVETVKDVDVASFGSDARLSTWQVCDIANDYERMYLSIKPISISVVRITSDNPLPAGAYRLIAPVSFRYKFSEDSAWDGIETTKDINVSGSLPDARLACWDFCDNSNDFERMLLSIKSISASVVRITSDLPLTAGSYRLIGVM
jgi:hypothetical protein